jgi:hypothetical protein
VEADGIGRAVDADGTGGRRMLMGLEGWQMLMGLQGQRPQSLVLCESALDRSAVRTADADGIGGPASAELGTVG